MANPIDKVLKGIAAAQAEKESSEAPAQPTATCPKCGATLDPVQEAYYGPNGVGTMADLNADPLVEAPSKSTK